MLEAFITGTDELKSDETNLRWRTRASVGKLSYWQATDPEPQQGSMPRSRYVYLVDVANVLLDARGGTRHPPAQVSLPWTGVYIIQLEGTLKIVWTTDPMDVMYYFQLTPTHEVVATPIRTPYLTWIGQWDKTGALTETRLLCSETPVMDMNSPVTAWPFGNVYTKGRICWGGVNLYQAVVPATFHTLPQLFFTSIFNGDLWRGSNEAANYLYHTRRDTVRYTLPLTYVSFDSLTVYASYSGDL